MSELYHGHLIIVALLLATSQFSIEILNGKLIYLFLEIILSHVKQILVSSISSCYYFVIYLYYFSKQLCSLCIGSFSYVCNI